MFKDSPAFSGFSVNDITAAKDFYGGLLGLQLETSEAPDYMFSLKLSGGSRVVVYLKPEHQPADFTILNFPVSDITAAVDQLEAKGISIERYPGITQDDKGVAHGPGPTLAWFKDPAGNILSVIEQ